MAWKDSLRPASFRGVPFYVDSHEAQGGRRVVTHEFPLRDKPYTEDMGRHAQSFTIEAFVIGADYFGARDALVKACDGEGAADLVHPYLGTIKVNCSGWTLRETKTDGRMARFSLTFVESGESEYPSSTSDFASKTGSLADTVAGYSLADFGDEFDIDGLPDFCINDATEIFTEAADFMISTAKTVTNLLSVQSGPFSQFMGSVNLFQTGLSSLVRTPLVLASQFHGLMNSLGSLFDGPSSAVSALAGFFGFGDDKDPIITSTPTRQAQQNNRNAINALVRQSAAIEAARYAADPALTISPTQSNQALVRPSTQPTLSAPYQTEDDAIAVRNSIIREIDDISEDPITSDDVYSSLQDVRAAVVDGVPPPNVSLPNLVTVTPIKTVPALVLAYDLYEDAGRDLEIVSRNDIAYPGFVPGAEPLRVLTNE